MPNMEAKPDPSTAHAALRSLPSVDQLLQLPAVANLLDEFPRSELVAAVRQTMDEQRARIQAGQSTNLDAPVLALAIRQRLYQRSRPNLRPVINATGIVLHTGLGRAPLAQEAIEAITEVARGYCNLELELETGKRGDRHRSVRDLLRELTGAEDGLVVNNNAAATYLVLNTFAAGGEAVISRGQLVEIGGSYRIPDIMAVSGCRMVEVGTTNRTRIDDYRRAITAETRAFVRVHTSNYRIQGFVASASLEELVRLASDDAVNILVIDDLGSGLLRSDIPWSSDRTANPPTEEARPRPAEEAQPPSTSPMPAAPPPTDWDEPSVRESVAAGADLTLFSGDKLLGGPQAGIIVGRGELIARLRENPLMRTYRPDKMTLAGLEATLRLYRDPDALRERLPIFHMLAAPLERLAELARTTAGAIRRHLPDADASATRDESYAGGGSLPTIAFPTWVVRVRHPALRSGDLAAALRERDVPIICRVQDDAVVFDLRTVRDDEAEQIPAALADVIRELPEDAP